MTERRSSGIKIETAAASQDVREIAANTTRDLALGVRLVALRLENFEPGQGKEIVRELADRLSVAAKRAVELYYLESLTQALAAGEGPLRLRRRVEEFLTEEGTLEIERFRTGIPGCYNQLGFSLLLDCELDRARRREAPLGVALFKLEIPSRAVVIELARQGRECCRLLDVIGAFGDRAVAMLLPDTDPGGARAAAQRVISSFRSARESAGNAVIEVVKIGLADHPRHGTEASQLLKVAAQAAGGLSLHEAVAVG